MRYLARWTPEEDAYLAANYATAPLMDMSRHLDRTIKALQRRAQSLGFARENHSTKGMKFPNRKRPVTPEAARTRRHAATKVPELQRVIASWVR